jgi:hypothetical protein
MIIRAGFRASCIPAGSAEAWVCGDMCIEDAEDAISLLEVTIRQIRRQIAANRDDPKDEAKHD